MKYDLEIMFGFVLCMLIVLFVIQAHEIKSLQTQIEELRVVVNQKFLPAMILENANIR